MKFLKIFHAKSNYGNTELTLLKISLQNVVVEFPPPLATRVPSTLKH